MFSRVVDDGGRLRIPAGAVEAKHLSVKTFGFFERSRSGKGWGDEQNRGEEEKGKGSCGEAHGVVLSK